MPITNNNKRMIDRPIWEQLNSSLANTAAGACIVDDNARYIYAIFSATTFYRYDTWADTWQQLASPPGGTLAAGSCMRYVAEMGTQYNGVVYGSVYALIANGTAVVFYRYDIATNTWSAALSVANVPAAWGTDGRMVLPEPFLNAWQGGYHGATSLNTVTLTAAASAGATSLAVAALPQALPANAVLNFGTLATPLWAVLTAAAAAGATALTVSALPASIASGASAYWYADLYLIGNAAAQVYRYNIASNTWSTTSSNSGTPALAAMPSASGAGAMMAWLPASGTPSQLNELVVVRGAGTSNIFTYNLVTNTWSTLTIKPDTEPFSSGSSSGVLADGTGKNAALFLQKDATGRIYRLDLVKGRIDPVATQSLIAQGTAVTGDKMTILKDPEGGIPFIYSLVNTSAFFLRMAMPF